MTKKKEQTTTDTNLFKLGITEKDFNNFPEKEVKNRVLKGVAYYAKVHKPDYKSAEKFGGIPTFSVCLIPDDPELAHAFGLILKEPTEQIPEPYVQIKAKVGKKRLDTPEAAKPEILDSNGNEIPETMLIGNGSRIAVKFMTNWTQMSPRFGVSTYMSKIVVNSLVPYEVADVDMSEDGGFVVEAGSSAKSKATAAPIDDFEDDAFEDDDLPF